MLGTDPGTGCLFAGRKPVVFDLDFNEIGIMIFKTVPVKKYTNTSLVVGSRVMPVAVRFKIEST